MENYYFTFGSDEKFPYQNTYIIVVSSNYNDAIEEFRKKYPDLNPEEKCLNCSDIYSEKEWSKESKKNHLNGPAEIIYTDGCFIQKSKEYEGYDDLFIFVPETKQIIHIAEGTGDNLLQEYINEGFVDYIIYEQYVLKSDIPKINREKILLKKSFREIYECTSDCIQDVLEIAYGNSYLDSIILS